METDKLKALYIVIATVAIGGTVYTAKLPKPDTTRADVIDGGIAQCPRRHLICDVRVSEEGKNLLRDAGVNLANLRRYASVRVRARACDQEDGGVAVLLPPMPFASRLDDLPPFHVVDWAQCDPVAHDGTDQPGWEPVARAQSRCLWKQADAGANCTRLDGGDPGVWNSYPRNQLTGADCQRAPCVVLAGEDPEAL